MPATYRRRSAPRQFDGIRGRYQDTLAGYVIPSPTVSVSESHRTHAYSEQKDRLLKRLARAEGQVRGVARMVEEDRYCIDILTQLAAIDTALERVALTILDDHVKHCVAGALASGDDAEGKTKIDELLAAVRRFAKTR
jgi:DNA-binding FrmR family transcriptional regulator